MCRLPEIGLCLRNALSQYKQEIIETEEIQPGLKSHDLDTLKPGEWLNDVIINKYLELLIRSSPDACLLSSFFYEELCRIVNPSLPDGWYRKKHMLIPVCIGSHWSLLCVTVHKCTIDIYNSMPLSQRERECACVRNYVNF